VLEPIGEPIPNEQLPRFVLTIVGSSGLSEDRKIRFIVEIAYCKTQVIRSGFFGSMVPGVAETRRAVTPSKSSEMMMPTDCTPAIFAVVIGVMVRTVLGDRAHDFQADVMMTSMMK
jgi:hypothetical protein